ncbi:MAG: gluconate 2-dehydrogenase subunit 3 family protein [Hyphomonadaceae bacterium]|nr:gluconate 2-dehydrogenase subunit 3 family protein [Hyphomonadaceae bacterium]
MANLLDRRSILKTAGLFTLAFTIAGCDVVTTPKAAREQNADFKSLSGAEVAVLDKLADILLPGAREAGFAHFIDAQVSTSAGESLSLLRYLDWGGPFKTFYSSGIAALDAVASERHGKTYANLTTQDAHAIVEALVSGVGISWPAGAPPAFLWYFVTRSDAVDVVYGTEAGFDRLGILYAEHILPHRVW